MAENKISYLNRTFDDYKNSLKTYISQYYPQIATDLNDASIGSWLVDMVSLVGDNLSYYIDKAYNETNIDTAQQRNSLLNLARTNGLRIPGPKGSVALCDFSVELPIYSSENVNQSGLGMPAKEYAPVIKRGTKVTSRDQVFEVMHDIDFNEEFDYNGFPNLKIIPITTAGSNKPVRYKLVKSEIVTAGESRIYKQIINNPNDIHPFMEIIIPDTDIMNIESIIFKVGNDYMSDPTMLEFMYQGEVSGDSLYRYFEVDSLTDSYRWGDSVTEKNVVETYKYSSYSNDSYSATPVYSIVRGEWKPVTQKFITEFTDNGYLKVIFGSGEEFGAEVPQDVDSFTKYQISKIVKNNFLGKLPRLGTTMYVLYRVGGGAASNVAANTITNVSNLDISFSAPVSLSDSIISNIRNSVKVTNNYPSVTGKDAPSIDEIRAMIKYNSGAQQRCVTLKDYENRVMLLPPRYGTPFRVRATEENNKVILHMLGINSDGTLSSVLPEQLIKNIANYLSMYRSINDFIEMRSGKIVNLGVDVDLFIDKAYNAYDVISQVIATIKDFFDISKHQLGDVIYLSKLSKAITDVDGVLNLMELRIINKTGPGYSQDQSVDPIITDTEYADGVNDKLIDIVTTKYVLNSDMDAMFEIKDPDSDIKVRSMVR